MPPNCEMLLMSVGYGTPVSIKYADTHVLVPAICFCMLLPHRQIDPREHPNSADIDKMKFAAAAVVADSYNVAKYANGKQKNANTEQHIM